MFKLNYVKKNVQNYVKKNVQNYVKKISFKKNVQIKLGENGQITRQTKNTRFFLLLMFIYNW